MKQNLKFIEIENDVVTICDVLFEPYHVQHLKSFLEHNEITCGKTQKQLTDDFNHQKFNSIQSLKEHLGLSDEIINVDTFIEKPSSEFNTEEYEKLQEEVSELKYTEFEVSATVKQTQENNLQKLKEAYDHYRLYKERMYDIYND